MKTKVIIAVLVLLLAVSLVACNSENDVTVAEVDAVQNGKVIGDRVETVVEAGTESVDVTNMISTVSNAPWKLFRDSDFSDEIEDKVVPGEGFVLNNGDNLYYIEVTSLDGEKTARYTLAIHKRFVVTATILNSEGLVVTTEHVDSYEKYEPETDLVIPEGYELESWKADDDLWAQDHLIRRATTFEPVISPKSYTVTIALSEGETLASGDTRHTVSYDQTYAFPLPSDETVAAKAAAGYAFGGWENAYSGEAFTDVNGIMTAPWERDVELTLKASWIPVDYTVSYEAAGGAVPESNPTSYNVENVYEFEFLDPVRKVEGTDTVYNVTPLTRLINATYEIYVFEGWYFDGEYTTPVNAENWAGRTGNVTLYAKYADLDPNAPVYYSETKESFNVDEGVLWGAYPQSEVTDATVLEALNEDAVKLPGPDYTAPAEGIPAWLPFEEVADNSMWYMDADFNGELYRGVYFTAYRGAQKTNGYAVNAVHWFKWEPVLWKAVETVDGSIAYITNKIMYSESSDRAIASVETFGTQAFIFDHPAGDIEIGLPDSALAAGIVDIAATDYAEATGFGGAAYWTLSAEGTLVPNGTGATADASVGVYVTIKIATEVEEPQEPQEPTEPVEPVA